ncbi:MAG: SPOR domain-containing protein [Schleiferiaceae bacterium]|nr:SPOR domain-containing protein [Schleiferiaceae bacterium]
MNLEQAIGQLLYQHDCVIVPGFGGFITKSVPAYISNATQMFVPPSKKISFNAQLSENDGLLANFISKKLGCEYNEALAAIQGTVDLWKETLDEEHPLKIDDIGRFYYDKEKNLQFKPKVDANFEWETFGLPVFRAPILESESTFQRMNRTATPREVVRTRPWSWMRIAAVLLPVLGLLTIGSLKSDLYQNNNLNVAGLWSSLTSFVEEASPAANTDESTNQEEIEVVIITGAQDELDAMAKPQALSVAVDTAEDEFVDTPSVIESSDAKTLVLENTTVDVAQLPFQIVVGSFSNRENAQKFVNDLEQSGKRAFILEGSGLVKVSCGGFTTRHEAAAAVQDIKATTASGAWILAK